MQAFGVWRKACGRRSSPVIIADVLQGVHQLEDQAEHSTTYDLRKYYDIDIITAKNKERQKEKPPRSERQQRMELSEL